MKYEEGKTREFTPEGNLKYTPKEYLRDKDGYIVAEIYEDEDRETSYGNDYKYNDKMQICKILYEDENFYGITDLKYNNQGLVVSKYEESKCIALEGIPSGEWNEKYTYTKFDKYGNWISRDYISNIKEYNLDLDNNTILSEETKTGTQTRKITYYE